MTEGITIWLTGLSGSGKSTIANELKYYFINQDKKYQILDGDVTRQALGDIFGYTRAERMKMSAVNRLIANLLNLHGVNVIMPVIAPYHEMRNLNRDLIKNYIEIYVECSLETCRNRDVKGLYKKANDQNLYNMIGIDDIYEIPENFDFKVNTDNNNLNECIKAIEVFLDNYINNKKVEK